LLRRSKGVFAVNRFGFHNKIDAGHKNLRPARDERPKLSENSSKIRMMDVDMGMG